MSTRTVPTDIYHMVSEMVSEVCGKRKMIFEKGGRLLCWGST